MLTMHSEGGPEMIYDSVEALEKEFGKDRPLVLAITILTSINRTLMNWWMGIPGTVEEEVVRRARLAMVVGADGVVCSPNEAARVREACGEKLLIVTPGIRFSGEEERDQKRVNTPRAAIANGSDMLVMGSDLRKGNPEENVTRAIHEIELGLQDRLK
jgi:orotidine-5'-phosphate decarboxylase